jgi:hypothetical protein
MDRHQTSTEEGTLSRLRGRLYLTENIVIYLALAQALLRTKRRLVQAEEEERFLRQRMCTLEMQLAAASRTSSFGLVATNGEHLE